MISKSLLSYCIYLYKTSLTFTTARADKRKKKKDEDKFRGSSKGLLFKPLNGSESEAFRTSREGVRGRGSSNFVWLWREMVWRASRTTGEGNGSLIRPARTYSHDRLGATRRGRNGRARSWSISSAGLSSYTSFPSYHHHHHHDDDEDEDGHPSPGTHRWAASHSKAYPYPYPYPCSDHAGRAGIDPSSSCSCSYSCSYWATPQLLFDYYGRRR